MNEDLVRRMVEVSELHGEFVLSSGATSAVYFDKFRFLTRPDLLDQVAAEVARLLAPSTELLGAPEGAAMLLVAAVSLRSGLPVTVVRKRAKDYGTRAQVEGEVPAGAITTLLEDVSTTGHQVRRAAEILTDAGADVR
ncbi:MAG: orotate phosphoribosyltransferase [Actinobacteria bacterium]|nr:MAG: orotate phosphoribosyltransferase [Actinomycetota bacterium]